MVSRGTLILEIRAARASWPAVVFVYLMILGAMVLSGMAIT